MTQDDEAEKERGSSGADLICWVESAKAAPSEWGFPSTNGDPVRCPNCDVDMRCLEADCERLDVACPCGVTVSGFCIEEVLGGCLITRRRERGLEEWLVSGRRSVLLSEKRRKAVSDAR